MQAFAVDLYEREPSLTSEQRNALCPFVSDLGQDACVTMMMGALNFSHFKNFVMQWAGVQARVRHNPGYAVTEEENAEIFSYFNAVVLSLGKDNLYLLQLLKTFVPVQGAEAAKFSDWNTPLVSNLCLLFVHICKRWTDVMAKLADDKAAAPEVIPESYNPPKFGASYSFRPDGNRVRSMRDIKVAKGKDGDEPDYAGTCKKNFARPPSRSYLMFFFCPHHGHCWGKLDGGLC